MGRRVFRGTVLAGILLAAGATAAQARYVGSVGLVAGSKWLASGDWSPVDRQDELGVKLAFEEERAPIWFAIEVLRSHGSADADVPLFGPVHDIGTTIEYSLGVRKVWGRRLVRPYVGGGGMLVAATIEELSSFGRVERNDTSVGAWVDAGVIFRLRSGFETGLDIRFSRANIDLGRGFEEIQKNAGGVHAGIVIGYGW